MKARGWGTRVDVGKSRTFRRNDSRRPASKTLRVISELMGLIMSRPNRLYALAFTLVLTGALPGCAAYRECGFGGCPGDAEITAEVRALFDQHPVLEPPNLLEVQTLDHVVYLNGVVDTDLERQTAESIAHQAKGVTKVVNSIGLSGGR